LPPTRPSPTSVQPSPPPRISATTALPAAIRHPLPATSSTTTYPANICRLTIPHVYFPAPIPASTTWLRLQFRCSALPQIRLSNLRWFRRSAWLASSV
jgi:hypothetical protein